jgi:hypothetical protein
MDHPYYATRTRHKKDPDANEIYPVFPPPNVVLHPDDAASKVFMAVARAFISVVSISCLLSVRFFIFIQDNRAMTIKDIADRASHYGLVCQKYASPPPCHIPIHLFL